MILFPYVLLNLDKFNYYNIWKKKDDIMVENIYPSSSPKIKSQLKSTGYINPFWFSITRTWLNMKLKQKLYCRSCCCCHGSEYRADDRNNNKTKYNKNIHFLIQDSHLGERLSRLFIFTHKRVVTKIYTFVESTVNNMP